MLADNIVYLKKENPTLYEALKATLEKGLEYLNDTIILEDTRSGGQTIKIMQDGKTNYLHSKYDPLKEAQIIIDNLEKENEISENTHIIFYGLGLGYHIDAFIKRYPNVDFSIYEPSLAILNIYLEKKALKDLPVKCFKGVTGEYHPAVSQIFFSQHIKDVQKNTIFCILPAYEKSFKSQYDQFFAQAKTIIKNKRMSFHTNYAFKKRWILNSALNFGQVLKTPNILMDSKGVFKDKPAILVSAGPSLNDEIEHLRQIKNEGLAYIFTVGSAINTLIHHEIYPDAMCTYDPTEKNQIVFNKVNELKVDHIPMIFGSSVGFEVLQQYKGSKYHMLTNQDTVSNYFLKMTNGESFEFVQDAPSIAVVALELLNKLKFSEIILVGQNLAYLNNKVYADGIDYHQNNEEVDQEVNKDGLIKDRDVMGETVYTTDSYLSMKGQMEHYIKELDLKVINTTKGGIRIEGAGFIPMDQVLKEKLNASIVDEDAFNKIENNEIYDQTYLQAQWLKMEQAYLGYKELLSLTKEKLLKIDRLIRNKNTRQALIMYDQFDDIVLQMENNDFFKVFALPMHRVEYELLANKVLHIKNEKDDKKRLEKLVSNLAGFMGILLQDSQLNDEIVKILGEEITK